MPISDREFGELTERVRGIQSEMMMVRADIERGNQSIEEILLKLSSVSGGWKVLMAVGAIAATIGGLIVKVLPMVIK